MSYIPLKLNLDKALLLNHYRKIGVQICVHIVLPPVQRVCINLIRSAEAYNASNGANKVDTSIAGSKSYILIYNMSIMAQ